MPMAAKLSVVKSTLMSTPLMPVEVKLPDLVRLGLVDPFEAEHEDPGQIAKRLLKAKVLEARKALHDSDDPVVKAGVEFFEPESYNAAATIQDNILFGKLAYDPVRDFAPITQSVSVNNLIVVHPALPVKTLKDFVALAKKRPGEINYATSGVGSSGHLAAELFKKTAGIQITHIAYKGGGQAITDAIAGHVPVYFAAISTVVPHVKSARVIPIAVTTKSRSAIMPDVPTVAELGYPGYEAKIGRAHV